MTSGDLTPEAAIPSRTVDDVATAHSRWWDGLLDEDVLALDTLLADDLTFHSPGGRVMTKAHFLDGLRSGRLQYDSITAAEPVIRLHGDTAIVTGRVDIQLRASGQPVAEGLYYTGSVRRVILTRVMPVGALLFDFHNTLVHLPRPVADEQWHE